MDQTPSRKWRFFLALPALAAAVFLACAAEQRPYQFVIASGSDPAAVSTDIASAMSAAGYPPSPVQPIPTVVYSRWEDTGFMYGQLPNGTMPANIVRRFSATRARSGAGEAVVVRMEAMRCTQGQFNTDGVEVNGECQRMDGLVPKHQQELEALGAAIERALGGR